VSLVNFGANPNTGGTVTMRQRFAGRPAPFGQLRDSTYEGRKRAAALAGIGPDSTIRARMELERLRHPPRVGSISQAATAGARAPDVRRLTGH